MKYQNAIYMILLALLVLCAGCVQSEPAGQLPAGDISPVPEYGGKLIQPMLGEPDNLIPPLSSSSSSTTITSNIYVAPLKYNKDIELVPWAAESFEVLDGGKLLRFKLREDIRWFDGMPVTAADVEFTYKMMIDPDTPTAYAGDYLAVKDFKRTGKYSFEVRYDEVFARATVTWARAILPKHALEGADLTKTPLSRMPLGAGPYKLKEWVAGQHLILEANEDFFEGKPYIDELVYRIIPDSGTQFMELKAGNINAMSLTPQQYLYQTKGNKWKELYNRFMYPSSSYTYLGYNLKHPLFKNRNVRVAIAHAIDKDELVRGVLYGLGEETVGPYRPGTWMNNTNIQPYAYSPEQALEMLAKEGWIDSDKDGVLDKDGKPFEFTALTNQGNVQRIRTATILQARLAAIGIKMKIRTVEWAAFIREFVNKGRFDAVILGWTITQDPDIFDVWHSSRAVEGGLNFVHYINPELDELLLKGRHSLDRAYRKKVYDQVQEVLHRDQPYCFLYVPMALPIVSAKVQGVKVAPAGIGYNSEKWWIPKFMQQHENTKVIQ
ncbi:MAG: peptide-binding protein [Desulfovibrio sp.]